MNEGAIVEGIGNPFFDELTFTDGGQSKTNIDTYRLIRHAEAPKKISTTFVQND